MITCRNVFNVWPKTTLLPMWPRDTKRLDTPDLGVPEKPSVFFLVQSFYLLFVSSWLKQTSQCYTAPESRSAPPALPPASVEVSLALPLPVLASEESFFLLPLQPADTLYGRRSKGSLSSSVTMLFSIFNFSLKLAVYENCFDIC